jgi:hypothetical protein
MVTVQHSSSILALKGIPSRRRPVGSEEEGSITCWIGDLKAGDLAAAHPLLSGQSSQRSSESTKATTRTKTPQRLIRIGWPSLCPVNRYHHYK